MIKKINKDNYYMKIAETVAIKSNCLCAAFGCIIVKDDQIISTGYVGAPRKTKDCIDLGFCIRRKKNVKSGTGYEMCRSVHAEMNCVSSKSLTILPNGEIKKIKNVHSTLLALDTSNFKIVPSEAFRLEKEKKEVLKITTKGNHELEVSPDHEMFVMDQSSILKTKKAKDLTINNYLPFINKIDIKGSSQHLPKTRFNSFNLTCNGIQKFKDLMKINGISWKKLTEKANFSAVVISRLINGKGIEKNNKEKIIKLFPQLANEFVGLEFRNIKIPKKTSPDFCQIAGYFLGDGSLSKNFVAFHDENKELLEFYKKLAKKVFNINSNIIKSSKKTHYVLHLCSYKLYALFKELDFNKSDKRQIPPIFHKVDDNSLSKFLRGYFDAEGTVGPRAIHLTSQGKDLLEIARLLLLRFGIISSLYKIKRKEGGFRNSPCFSLEITGNDLDAFIKKIGFSHPLKKERLKRVANKAKSGPRHSSVKVYPKNSFRGDFGTTHFPLLRDRRTKIIGQKSAQKIILRLKQLGLNEKNLPKLENLIENLVFLKIKKIEKFKKKVKMIDYFVPKFNSFLVNGFMVHNCIINAARAGVSLLGGDMFLFTAKRVEDNKFIPVRAYPCLLCKKMIINAGLNRLIGNNKDRSLSVYFIKDWVKNWQKIEDISQDKEQYGIDYKK